MSNKQAHRTYRTISEEEINQQVRGENIEPPDNPFTLGPTKEFRLKTITPEKANQQEGPVFRKHQLAPPLQDNGLTASHYELPEGATELKHLIWHKNMNAQVGEAFRALYRLDDCVHSNRRRDLNKAKAYIDQELERMERYGE